MQFLANPIFILKFIPVELFAMNLIPPPHRSLKLFITLFKQIYTVFRKNLYGKWILSLSPTDLVDPPKPYCISQK